LDFVIETDRMSGGYGGSIVLRGMSLRVPRGAIYGFLGPNGAGKSNYNLGAFPSASDFDAKNRNAPNTACGSSDPGSGWRYDCVGNIVRDLSNGTYAYDAENRQVAYCPGQWNPTLCTTTWATGNTVYSYDGEGRRVQEKRSDGTVATFVYDAGGQLAAEYGTPMPAAGTVYLTVDNLGSTRLLTDGSGAPVSRMDYLPFGGPTPSSLGGRSNVLENAAHTYFGDGGVPLKFTGKERDSETGLDYFGARYFSSAQGRFTSPDGVFFDQDPSDPQSWNLYSYVRNNPLRFRDLTGRSCVTLDNGTKGDDGDGKGCKDAGVAADKGGKAGAITPDVETVGVGYDEARLIMLEGVGNTLSDPRQLVDTAKKANGAALIAETLWELPGAIKGGWNAFRLWLATRGGPASLEELAAAGGPTIEVVTSQTQALSASRGLSTAVGEGAADVARTFQPNGTLYTAKIPQALVRGLQSRGLAEVRALPQGTELYFTAEAVKYVLPFFH
jgi:RHS repeat-associated protein